jgi:hypothetical protein
MIPLSPHDDEDDELAAGSGRAPTAPVHATPSASATYEVLSTNEAIVTIIKCAIGAASFSLPRAFQYGGVYFSLLSTLALGILNAYTLLLLVDSSGMASTLASTLPDESTATGAAATVAATGTAAVAPGSGNSTGNADVDGDVDVDLSSSAPTPGYTALMAPIGGFTYSVAGGYKRISYPEIGAIAYPGWTVTIGGQRHNAASLLISAGIVATSLGVCTAYLDFCSDTLPVVLRGWYKRDDIFLTRANCPFVLLPVVLALSYLRTMKVLTWTSGLGDVAVFAGCVVVIAYGIDHHWRDVTFQHQFVAWPTLSRYVGSNAFLMAIHIVILPLMHQMSWQSNDLSKRNAIVKSYVFISVFNASFGAAGYLLFAAADCQSDAGGAAVGPCDNILSNISSGRYLLPAACCLLPAAPSLVMTFAPAHPPIPFLLPLYVIPRSACSTR